MGYDLRDLLLSTYPHIWSRLRVLSHSSCARLPSAAIRDTRGAPCALVTFQDFTSRHAITACELRKPDVRHEVLVRQLVYSEIERVSEGVVGVTASTETGYVSQKKHRKERGINERFGESFGRCRRQARR